MTPQQIFKLINDGQEELAKEAIQEMYDENLELKEWFDMMRYRDKVKEALDNATVDNSTYSYYLSCTDIDSSEILYGARISYTTDYD